MAGEAEAIYRQLGLLISQKPAIEGRGEYGPEQLQWVGRAFALVEANGNIFDVADFRAAMNLLNSASRAHHAQSILMILYRVLARLELQVPAEAQGAFINAGAEFSAFQAIGKVLRATGRDVLIVDPYLSVEVLFDFVPMAHEGVAVRLLSDGQSRVLGDGLRAGLQRWVQQYAARPVVARVTQPRELHDRLLLVDDAQAWILTQSLKDFAARAPGTLVRADPDLAAMKIQAYAAIWTRSQPL